jgi:hypothetical protein
VYELELLAVPGSAGGAYENWNPVSVPGVERTSDVSSVEVSPPVDGVKCTLFLPSLPRPNATALAFPFPFCANEERRGRVEMGSGLPLSLLPDRLRLRALVGVVSPLSLLRPARGESGSDGAEVPKGLPAPMPVPGVATVLQLPGVDSPRLRALARRCVPCGVWGSSWSMGKGGGGDTFFDCEDDTSEGESLVEEPVDAGSGSRPSRNAFAISAAFHLEYLIFSSF